MYLKAVVEYAIKLTSISLLSKLSLRMFNLFIVAVIVSQVCFKIFGTKSVSVLTCFARPYMFEYS